MLMHKAILFEPSIGSDNMGDQVIVDGIKSAFKDYFISTQVIELPTHTPLYNRFVKYLGEIDLKLICGSNLFEGNLFTLIHLRQWALSLCTLNSVSPCIFVGVGSQQYGQKVKFSSKLAYKKILSDKYIHSVRDSYTEEALKSIGVNNVVNTGCPSMWQLTQEHCGTIPEDKSDMVVCTLTDYKANSKRDNYILHTLKKEYGKVYFWPQGAGDTRYFSSLEEHTGIEFIPPSLDAYTDFLQKNSCDFIGTRLHGGIRSLQVGRRTLIIGVDNRAMELNIDFNVPVLSEKEIENLQECIDARRKTEIRIPRDNIKKFLAQFKFLTMEE